MRIRMLVVVLLFICIWGGASFFSGSGNAITLGIPLLIGFCLPGYFIAGRLGFLDNSSIFLKLSISGIIGYAASTLLGVAVLAIRPEAHRLVLILPSIIALVLFFLFRRKKPHTSCDPSFDISWNEITVWALLMVAVVWVVALPLGNIGYSFPEGRAFRAYFNVDYLKHLAVSAHLAHSGLPPDNPYLLSTESFHYYWLFYVFPASMTGLEFADIDLLDHFRNLNVAMILLFCSLIWGYLRRTGATVAQTALSLTAGIFAYSYEGLNVVWRIVQQDKSFWMGIREFNVDAATRWFIGHPQIDGIYRMFIYTPQHLFALALLIIALFESAKYVDTDKRNTTRMTASGVTAGLIFGFSSFLGAAAVMWYGCYQGLLLIKTRSFRKPVLAMTGMLAPYALFAGLGMIVSKPGSLFISPQRDAIRQLPLFLLLNFGALVILAPWGIRSLLRRQYWLGINAVILTSLSLLLILTVQVREFPSDVGLKLGLIVHLMFMIWTAEFLVWKNKKQNAVRAMVIFLLCLMAVPTVLIDRLNSSNVWDARFTSVVAHEDLDACEWIRKNTSADSVVQAEPFERGVAFSLIPTFAHRRTALGDRMHSRIFLGNESVFLHLNDKVNRIFGSNDPVETQVLLNQTGIDYVYIGSVERRLFPHSLRKFDDFVCGYRKRGVSVHSNIILADLRQNRSSDSDPTDGDSIDLNLDIESNDPEKTHHFQVDVYAEVAQNEAPVILDTRIIRLGRKETQRVVMTCPASKTGLNRRRIFCSLIHLKDEQDSELKSRWTGAELFHSGHTIGKVLTFEGKTSAGVAEPSPEEGSVFRSELGIYPPGQYEIELIYPDEVPNPNLAELEITHGRNCGEIAHGDLYSLKSSGLKSTQMFEISEPLLISAECSVDRGGIVAVEEMTLRWIEQPETSTPFKTIEISF